MTATIECVPFMSNGLTASKLLEMRKRRYRCGIRGWIRWLTDANPNEWMNQPPTRDELSFYWCHMSGCMHNRLSFDPEIIGGSQGARVTYCLTRYAEREERELDQRPWWAKLELAEVR